MRPAVCSVPLNNSHGQIVPVYKSPYFANISTILMFCLRECMVIRVSFSSIVTISALHTHTHTTHTGPHNKISEDCCQSWKKFYSSKISRITITILFFPLSQMATMVTFSLTVVYAQSAMLRLREFHMNQGKHLPKQDKRKTLRHVSTIIVYVFSW